MANDPALQNAWPTCVDPPCAAVGLPWDLGVDDTPKSFVKHSPRSPNRPNPHHCEFSRADSRRVDDAATRLAAAAGYGRSWGNESPGEVAAQATDQGGIGAGILAVAYRTKAYIGTTGDKVSDVKRLRVERTVNAVVARPTRPPSQEVYAAAGSVFAPGITGPLRPLLFAFALESWEHWLQVEPFLERKHGGGDAGLIAGRDAMARIMYRVAGTSIKDRARQLQVRKETYLRMTRDRETTLRAWIVTASVAFLRASDVGGKPNVGGGPANVVVARWWDKRQARALGWPAKPSHAFASVPQVSYQGRVPNDWECFGRGVARWDDDAK